VWHSSSRSARLGPLVAVGLFAVMVTACTANAPIPTPRESSDRIAFARWGPTEERSQPPQLWTMNADGSDLRAVGDGQRGWYIEWSPDRSHLIFDLPVDGSEHIATVRIDGSEYTQLTTGDGFFADPAYSPDGATIAYAYAPDATVEPDSASLWLMDADGENPRALLSETDSGSDWEPVYSPDGAQIAFTRQVAGEEGITSAIHIVNADGTGVRALTPFDDYVEHPRWSADGQTIIYNIEHAADLDDPRNGVWTIPAAGGEPTSLLPSDSDFHFFKPVYSPDGQQILVGCAHREGLNEDLCVADADGTDVRLLIETADYENHGVW
jgi:Tol biopolymer transport system component